MSELRASFASARESLVDGLCEEAGFKLLVDGYTLLGEVDIDGLAIEHEIRLSEDFPIVMPKVRTSGGEGGMSWHRERGGELCLWSNDEAAHLPWLRSASVIDRIKEWHANDAAGWPDDPPDLDLERYWDRTAALIVYPDLDDLASRPCKVVRGVNGTYVLASGKAPRRRRQRVREWAATVVDVGELSEPIHVFEELADLIAAEDAATLRAGIEEGSVKVVLVRYQRQGHNGVLGLVAFDRNPHDLRAAETAHDGESTRYLRAGLDAETLLALRVAVVGVGAVGSAVAEMFVRSGLGEITLVDGDLIHPGNCIRHVADLGDVGRAKVEAVKRYLVDRDLIAPECVHIEAKMLTSPDEAERLFVDHDLVVDASGNGPVSALLHTASRVLQRPAVSVCLQRNGTVARVDRMPLDSGEAHLEAVGPGGPETDLREGGCGDPVSPTPPWACSFAAARAVGMSVDILSGRRQSAPSIVDYLIELPADDALPSDAS